METKVFDVNGSKVVLHRNVINGEVRYSANDGVSWHRTVALAYHSARRQKNIFLANQAFAVKGGQRMYGWATI